MDRNDDDGKGAGHDGPAITKRAFLGMLAASAAPAGPLLAVATPSDAIAAASPPWTVIIAGGGTAGMVAAIFAAQRGARILVVEAADTVGGSLFLSGGNMSAAGTRLQKQRGIIDSPDLHYEDVMRISRNTADPAIVRLAVDQAAPTFDWLMDIGLVPKETSPILGPPHHDPDSVPRYAAGAEGGRSILAALQPAFDAAVKSGRVTVRTGTRVTRLIQNGVGAVTGVEWTDAQGGKGTESARSVLLATGGYSANAALIRELEGVTDYSDITYPFSQGDGIGLGRTVGASIVGGDKHLPLFGNVLASMEYPARVIASVRAHPSQRRYWEIIVNLEGKRYFREDIESFDGQEYALRKQPREQCFVIFDETILQEAPPGLIVSRRLPWSIDQIRAAFDQQKPMFFKGETPEALARVAGLPPDALRETIDRFNRAQAGALRDSFGREFMPRPLVKPPFYAIRLHGSLTTTFAGVKVDGRLQVLRDGMAIPGLYAAGEVLGGAATMGESYCSGMMVMPALSFGRLLGQSILPV